MKRYTWIDEIKGFACIIVFLQHFTLSFFPSLWEEPGVFRIRPLAFIFNGSFAVSLFLIISFFFTARKVLYTQISTQDIASMCIKRYCRLTIPVAAIALFVFVIQESVGFYNQEASILDNNLWLDDYYPRHLTLRSMSKSVLCGVLWNGDWTINGPFWMLSTLFFGFFLTIIIACIAKHIHSDVVKYAILLIIFIIYYLQRSLLCCAVFAVLLALSDNDENGIYEHKQQGTKIIIGVLMLIMLLSQGYVKWLIIHITDHVRTDSFLLQYSFYNMLYAFFFLVMSRSIFEPFRLRNNLVTVIGKYSMGIYLYHWPIMCSLSCLIYIKYARGHVWRLMLLMGLTIIVSLTMSYLHTIMIENRIIKMVNNWIDNMIV